MTKSQLKLVKMLDEAEYASDTDESDDDYKPGGDASDVASEVDSDGEAENDDDGNEAEAKRGNRKRRAAKEAPSVESKRTRQSTEVASKSTEKDTLDDADDDDVNEDALWASFLSNTGQTASKPANPKPSPQSKTVSSTSNGNSKQPEIPKPITNVEQKKVVTEIFEFAGEKVEIQKVVTVSAEQKESSSEQSSVVSGSSTAQKPTKAAPIASFNRRSGGSGGLSSVLGQIGKKNKLSILEKTKLDWTGFKRNEGIDEEIQTHNKGRDGYLERQDFLQRTDLRQFEIEKNMRQANRRK